MFDARAKIVDADTLAATLDEHRAEGKTVVQCHGCFDIVHPGHIRYLNFARSLGDLLVVSITSDSLIDKGYDRPYIHEGLRAESLASLELVDYVVVDDNPTARELLLRLRPEIYVKGKEYELSTDPRFLGERDAVESYGGQVVFSSGDVVFSSTKLLEHIRKELPMEEEKTRAFCASHGIDRTAVLEAVGSFRDLEVVVLGDAILDHYRYCEDVSIASESPMISVTPVHEETFVGGAALIAAQVAALGGRATLVTTLDDSPAAERFAESVRSRGVDLVAHRTGLRPVVVKTRYLVEESKVFKVDEGRRAPLAHDQGQAIARAVEERLAGADLLVATDFGYGLFGATLIQAVAELTRATGVPFGVDVSRRGASSLLKFEAPRVATPTEEELRFALGDRDAGLSNLASRYLRETHARGLYVTLGRRGVIHFAPKPDGSTDRLVASYLPAFKKRPLDIVGAGDVFLAAVTMADARGASPQMAMYLGTSLAALHVMRLGNEPTSLADWTEALRDRVELVGGGDSA
jgi:rfaE bifunctional protein kinase chain/domain/rfaE bifunctional protein nucleotidyltransferase chain/domain